MDEFEKVWDLSHPDCKEELEERSSELSAGEDAKFDEYRDERQVDNEPEIDVESLFESLLERSG